MDEYSEAVVVVPHSIIEVWEDVEGPGEKGEMMQNDCFEEE